MPIIVVSYRMQTSMIIIGLFFFICSFVFYVFVYASTMRGCVSGLGHYGVMPSVAPILILPITLMPFMSAPFNNHNH